MTEAAGCTGIQSSGESSAGSKLVRITIGTSTALVRGAGWRTGVFERQPDCPQWSGSVCPDFGQHGWVGVTGAGTMATQVREAESNANISNRAGIALSPFDTECATLRTAHSYASCLPNCNRMKTGRESFSKLDHVGPIAPPNPSLSRRQLRLEAIPASRQTSEQYFKLLIELCLKILFWR